MLNAHLIYSLLALHVAIQQANVMSAQLGMPETEIRSVSQLTSLMVIQPRLFDWVTSNVPRDPMRDDKGLRVGLTTTNLQFTLDRSTGVIFNYLHASGPHAGTIDYGDDDGQIGVSAATVSDEGAKQLAISWLNAIGLNTNDLSRNYQLTIAHQKLPLTTETTVSSRFTTKWTGSNVLTGLQPIKLGCKIELNETKNPSSAFTWMIRTSSAGFCRLFHTESP